MGAADVVARRQAQRESLLGQARGFTSGLGPGLDVKAVVVIGSVARGDFNAGSDTDVLVVAANLPVDPLRRADALGPVPPGVEAVAWTPADWARAKRTGNPLWVEALSAGVWLTGSQRAIEAAAGPG
jgi:hypothetical protein